MKEYEKEIVIKIIWDDDSANIAHRPSDDKMRVKISGGNFKRMDPLFKLDFFTDMTEWVQSMVDDIHAKELNEEDRFTRREMQNLGRRLTWGSRSSGAASIF